MSWLFEKLMKIIFGILIFIVMFVTAERFGWPIGACIGIMFAFTAPYIAKKSGYGMLKKEGMLKVRKFRRTLNSSCHRCKGEGTEGGCPICGNWPGLGPHRNVEGEEYFLITNTKKRSFYYACQVLFKILGKKLMFDKAVNHDGDPMSSDWIAVWGVPEV